MQKRYSRNIAVENIGEIGQQKLIDSKVLVIGAGGLASPVLLYLASVGVGTIGIVDNDVVEISNLQRQVIHTEGRVGRLKTESAKIALKAINSHINIETYNLYLGKTNGEEIINQYDVIVDCTDNFRSKFVINDLALKTNKPLVHAGVFKMEGQIMTIIPNKTACYRCVFKEEPDKSKVDLPQVVGTIGATAGIIGSIQAMEVIKLITGVGELLTNRILVLDGVSMKFTEIPVKNSSSCSCNNH